MAEERESRWMEYLNDFLQVNSNKLSESSLPFKLFASMIINSEDQIESWTLNWCNNFLSQPPKNFATITDLAAEQINNNADQASTASTVGTPLLKPCPIDLTPVLCRATANLMLKADLSGCAAATKGWLDSAKLLTRALNTLHDVISAWRESLPAITVGANLPHKTSVYAIKNGRRKMEDAHCFMPSFNALYNLEETDFTKYQETPRQSFYAVFDGHGGAEAAEFAAANLHRQLVHHRSFPSDVPQALKDSIASLDDYYCTRIAPVLGGMAGCVAAAALFRERELHVAWLGDVQAVLVEGGQSVELTQPHKPEDPEERQRIENQGGMVIHLGTWRVNGNLAVSRAIGDASQKPYISSEAEVVSCDMDGSENYLVLACDGFWDVVDKLQLPTLVHELYRECNSKSSLAQQLVTHARKQGSRDNITVLIVFINDEIPEPRQPHVTSAAALATSEEPKQLFNQSREPPLFIPHAQNLPQTQPHEEEKREKSSSSRHTRVVIQNPLSDATFHSLPPDDEQNYTGHEIVEQYRGVLESGANKRSPMSSARSTASSQHVYHPWRFRPVYDIRSLKAKRTSLPMHMFWSYQGLSVEERRKLQQLMYDSDGTKSNTFITEVQFEQKPQFYSTYPKAQFPEVSEPISKDFTRHSTNHRLHYYSVGALPIVDTPKPVPLPSTSALEIVRTERQIVPVRPRTANGQLKKTVPASTSVKVYGSPGGTSEAAYRLQPTHRPRRWPRPNPRKSQPSTPASTSGRTTPMSVSRQPTHLNQDVSSVA